MTKYERTDKDAKEITTNGRIQPARGRSLAHVIQKNKEARNMQISTSHQLRTETREASSRGYYIPSLKPGIHHVLGRAPI